MRDGSRFKVDQTNNSYIFPGVGLGTLAVGARRVSDGMFMAAAKAVALKDGEPQYMPTP
jgi:malate dehydrogenase (oxaloacetate-decarboxylating)